MRKLGLIVCSAAACCFATSALHAEVFTYQVNGTLGGAGNIPGQAAQESQNNNTQPFTFATSYWNPVDAIGDPIGNGLGEQANISNTIKPVFDGTLTIDDQANTVVFDIVFPGANRLRSEDIPTLGSAFTQEITNWRQGPVNWSGVTVNIGAGTTTVAADGTSAGSLADSLDCTGVPLICASLATSLFEDQAWNDGVSPSGAVFGDAGNLRSGSALGDPISVTPGAIAGSNGDTDISIDDAGTPTISGSGHFAVVDADFVELGGELLGGSYAAGGFFTFTGTLVVDCAAQDDQFTVINDGSSTDFSVLDNDDCMANPPMSLVSVADPTDQGGTAATNGDLVTYTPAGGFFGADDTFLYTAQDGLMNASQATVTVTVAEDIVPIANDFVTTTAFVTAVDVDVLNDIPGNSPGNEETGPATYAATDGSNGAVVIAGSVATYTPDAGFEGDDSFTYTITDANGDPATGTVTVTVGADPNPVVANDANAPALDTTGVAPETLSSDIDVSAIPDNVLGAAPTITAENGANGSVSVNGSVLTYVPNADFFAGTDSFDYTIEDADGSADSGTISVVVDASAPTAGDSSDEMVSAGEDIQINVVTSGLVTAGAGTVNDHNFAVTSGPSNGTAAFSSPVVTYTPDPGFSGDDSFEYSVTDASGATATGTITISVQTISIAPPPTEDLPNRSSSSAVGPVGVLALLLLPLLRRRRRLA